MGSAPLAPGTTEPHSHCPCVDLWRHALFVDHPPAVSARLWAENTYLLDEVRSLKRRLVELERDVRLAGVHHGR